MEQRKILWDKNMRSLTKNGVEKRRVLQNQQRQNKRHFMHEIGRNIIVVQAAEEQNDNTNKENQVAESTRARQQKYVERFKEWKQKRQLEKEAKEKKRQPTNAAPTTQNKEPESVIYLLKTAQRKVAVKDGKSTHLRNMPIVSKLNMRELNDITVQTTQFTRKKVMTNETKKVEKIETKPTTNNNNKPTISTKVAPKLVKCFDVANAAPISKTTGGGGGGGAVAKVRQMQKRVQKEAPSKKRAINLGVTLKAKKEATTSTKTAAKGVKQFLNKPTTTINNNKIKSSTKDTKKPNGLKANEQKLFINLPTTLDEQSINTPSDIFRVSPRFNPCVTSTQEKKSFLKIPKLNEDAKNLSRNSSAKKLAQFFKFVQGSDSSESDVDDVTLKKMSTRNEPEQTIVNVTQKPSTQIETEQTITNVSQKPSTQIETKQTIVNVSQKPELIRQNATDLSDTTNNFVSSFVSVARGKGSARKEQKQRDSMYLNNTFEEPKSEQVYTVEQRRTLEAVGYFRKQLSDEIARLHAQCEIWEKYRAENEDMLEKMECQGMILAAVGQTRLLTSKKLQQFKGLIDRCEALVTGVGAKPDDGSEDTKAITAIDLEGFWSMLGIQFDNLDKYYANLERWKANNWIDPDSIAKKPVEKVKLPQKKKPAAVKATSSLRDMIRKKQAEKRQISAPLAKNNSIVIVTPSSKRNGSPALKHAILVQDRKRYSISPTVLTVATPKTKPRLSQSQSLLKNTLIAAAKEASVGTPTYTTPARKSILKTPHTQRSSVRRQVSFCARDYNFIIDSSEDESD